MLDNDILNFGIHFVEKNNTIISNNWSVKLAPINAQGPNPLYAVTQVQLRKTMDTSGDKLTAMEGYYENGELEIKLKLSGDARALTDKFKITAVLTYPNELSAAPSDIYQLTKALTTAPAIKLGEDKKTVTVTFEGVTADNTILLTGLPAGVTYKVTETPEKEYYINPVFSFESPDINNETLLDKAFYILSRPYLRLPVHPESSVLSVACLSIQWISRQISSCQRRSCR